MGPIERSLRRMPRDGYDGGTEPDRRDVWLAFWLLVNPDVEALLWHCVVSVTGTSTLGIRMPEVLSEAIECAATLGL